MPRLLFYFSLAVLSACYLASCKPPDKAETSAYYVGIDGFAVTDTDGTPINDYTIPHFWCYANGAAGGVAELGKQLPLPLLGGGVNLFLYPGVTANGIGQARVQYPFLTASQVDLVPLEGGRYVYRPTVQWVKDLKRPFPFDEDFENELSVDSGAFGKVVVKTDNQTPHPAGGRLYGVLEDPGEGVSRVMDMVQKEKIPLPQLGQPIYLEMLYRNNVSFQVGLVAEIPGLGRRSYLDLIIRENLGNWKKLYVYLGDVTNQFPQGSQFQVLVRAVSSGSKPEYVHLDNMRLMHLK